MNESLKFTSMLMGSTALASLSWYLFSVFVVPPLIESAYRGESVALLNGLLSGASKHGVERYLDAWSSMSKRALGLIMVFGLIPLPLALTHRRLQESIEARIGSVAVLRPLIFNLAIGGASFALLWWFFFFDPVGYVRLIAEDHWAEYGSFAAWGMASCFLGCAVAQHREMRKPVPVLLTLGAFFVAMEEISWGQRVMGIATPEAFADSNVQGEMNLHNLFPVVLSQYLIAGLGLLFWTMLYPLVRRRLAWVDHLGERLGVPEIPVRLWPLFAVAIVTLLGRSLLLSGEPGEMFLAVALAALGLDLMLRLRRSGAIPHAALSMAATGMVAVQIVLTAFLIGVYWNPGALTMKLELFASKQYPEAGMHAQAVKLYEFMDATPEHRRWDTKVRYGMALLDAGEFEKARKVLERALAETAFVERVGAADESERDRLAGAALAALGRPAEAKVALERAIASDRKRLANAYGTGAEARVRWSLGQTFLALGDKIAAARELVLARAAVRDAKTGHRLDEWMRDNFDARTYASVTTLSR